MSNEHNLNVMAEDVRRMNVAGCDSIAISTAELLSVLEFAQKQNAIVTDVEEVIGLLTEREWAEHCTKTDTGKRLEEAITELHNDAAPEKQPDAPVFGYVYESKDGAAINFSREMPMMPDRWNITPVYSMASPPQPAPPAPVVPADLLAQFTRHRLLEIIVTGPDASGAEQNTLARIALNFYPKPPEQTT